MYAREYERIYIFEWNIPLNGCFSGHSVYSRLINLLLLINRLFLIPNVRKVLQNWFLKEAYN